MKKTIIALWITVLSCAVTATASAQDAPPIPVMPALPSLGDDGVYNPSNPFSQPPPGLLEPMSVPDLPKGNDDSDAASMPLTIDDDGFDFFQPGIQLHDDEGVEKNNKAVETVEEDAPKPVIRKLRRKPLFVKRFNYKIQHLPETIYKKQYGRENRHLPKAMYEADYDAVTFAAAASNNINGVRALLNSGRDAQMRNARGQSLAMVAQQHGAQDVLRYLNAKGVY